MAHYSTHRFHSLSSHQTINGWVIMAMHGLSGHELSGHGLIRHGLIRHELICHGLICHGVICHGIIRNGLIHVDSLDDSCSGKFTMGLGQIHSASGGVACISGAGSLDGAWLNAGIDDIVMVRSIPSSRDSCSLFRRRRRWSRRRTPAALLFPAPLRQISWTSLG